MPTGLRSTKGNDDYDDDEDDDDDLACAARARAGADQYEASDASVWCFANRGDTPCMERIDPGVSIGGASLFSFSLAHFFFYPAPPPFLDSPSLIETWSHRHQLPPSPP